MTATTALWEPQPASAQPTLAELEPRLKRRHLCAPPGVGRVGRVRARAVPRRHQRARRAPVKHLCKAVRRNAFALEPVSLCVKKTPPQRTRPSAPRHHGRGLSFCSLLLRLRLLRMSQFNNPRPGGRSAGPRPNNQPRPQNAGNQQMPINMSRTQAIFC